MNGVLYLMTEDGSAGAKVQKPPPGPQRDKLIASLRRVYPTLREVTAKEYAAGERKHDRATPPDSAVPNPEATP